MSVAYFRALAREASRRYPARDRFARHYAYGKLSHDPVFRYVLEQGLVPDEGCVLDLGCGPGVLEALLAVARRADARSWPAPWAPRPAPALLRGIDLGGRDVERARRAAAGDAEFVQGDIRAAEFGRADLCVILDVLHYLEPAAQDDVLRRARDALRPRGTLLLRVADRSPTLAFQLTVAVDRAVMALRERRFGRYHYRPLSAWKEELGALGFEVASVPMSAGTPFANALLVARYHRDTASSS